MGCELSGSQTAAIASADNFMKKEQTYSRTIYLLRKYIKNKCDREETRELLSQLGKEKFGDEIDVVLFSLWKAINENEEISSNKNKTLRDEAADIIHNNQNKQSGKKHRQLIPFAIAATVALLLVLNFPVLKRNFLETNVFTSENTVAKQFTTENSIKKITLADGSVVHLNANTTLSLRKGKFNSKIREVWLDEGEVFFEVTGNPNRPFVVHTPGGLSTRVLGTSFNVQAYSELNKQVVSVQTGRVQVSRDDGENIVLEPNFQASFDVTSNKLTSRKTDGTLAAAWRDGKVVFQRAKADEIAFRLKQHYNIDLIYNESTYKNIEFSAVFSPKTPVEEIANTFSKIYDITYTIKDHRLYLE